MTQSLRWVFSSSVKESMFSIFWLFREISDEQTKTDQNLEILVGQKGLLGLHRREEILARVSESSGETKMLQGIPEM